MAKRPSHRGSPTFLLATLIASCVVSISVFRSIAHAQTCGPAIRLDKDGRSMSHVPVKTQEGDLGICYAFVAAQMVDAYRFSHAPPEGDRDFSRLTSPLAVATQTQTHDYNRDPILNGGETHRALEVLKSSGSCDSRLVEGRFNWYSKRLVLASMKPFLNRAAYERAVRDYEAEQKRNEKSRELSKTPPTVPPLDKTTREYLKTRPDVKKMSPDELSKLITRLQKKDPVYLENMSSCDGNTNVANTFVQSFYDVVNGFFERGERVIELNAAITRSCSEKPRHPFGYKAHTLERGAIYTRKFLQKIINERLSGPEPIQPFKIGFCQNILFRGNSYRGVTNIGLTTLLAKNCQPHAALIIGRRVKNGTCQFLVRNSWGTSCCPYSREWD